MENFQNAFNGYLSRNCSKQIDNPLSIIIQSPDFVNN